MTLFVFRVGDPVVATWHILQADHEHIETVFGDSQAKEIVIATDAKRTERVVPVHAETQAGY